MSVILFIGYAAAVLTTLAFLPQVIRIWKLRETRDLSLPTFLMFTTGVFFWLVYGSLTGDIPIAIANVVTLILAVIILGFKFRYG